MGLLEGVIYALSFDESKLANHAHRGRRDRASNRRFWRFASFRGNAIFRSLSRRTGYSWLSAAVTRLSASQIFEGVVRRPARLEQKLLEQPAQFERRGARGGLSTRSAH